MASNDEALVREFSKPTRESAKWFVTAMRSYGVTLADADKRRFVAELAEIVIAERTDAARKTLAAVRAHDGPKCAFVFCAPGHERCNATQAEHEANPQWGHTFHFHSNAPCAHAHGGEGVRRIAAERRRQIEVEGWTPEHDAQHADSGIYNKPALPQAAAVYAVTACQGEDAVLGCQNPGWPWAREWFKPASSIRMLEKAGALIAAEIDRIIAAREQAKEAGR